jgi:hypothetical protein
MEWMSLDNAALSSLSCCLSLRASEEVVGGVLPKHEFGNFLG